MRVVLELDEQLMRRIDSVALPRVRQARQQMTQYEWLNHDPAGKELQADIALRGKYNHLSIAKLNELVTEHYRQATGYKPKFGRPPLAEFRAQIITEALEAYLKPQEQAA